MDLQSAVEWFFADLEARRLSKNTIEDYRRTLKRFVEFMGSNKPITEISSNDIRLFLGNYPHLKAKSIGNMHAGLASMWTLLLAEEVVTVHVVRKVTVPKPDIVEVNPFTFTELKLLFNSIKRTKKFKRSNDSEPTSRLARFPKRNKAMLTLLLDTGIRASELCQLKFEDLDLKNQTITIQLGKGRKMRSAPFSASTAKSIWAYLEERKELVEKFLSPQRSKSKVERSNKPAPSDYVFIDSKSRPINRDVLWKTISDIGNRCEVHAYPHRFRHTFAIMYLRNGGNSHYLQQILGHQDFKMVKRYLAISKSDLSDAHKQFSPVANLNL